jgi:hypothetical protein
MLFTWSEKTLRSIYIFFSLTGKSHQLIPAQNQLFQFPAQSNPDRVKTFIFSRHVKTDSENLPASYGIGNRLSSSKDEKRGELETDHLIPECKRSERVDLYLHCSIFMVCTG